MKRLSALFLLALAVSACSSRKEVVLLTLDPGHFHAALVQKVQYPGVSRDVYVYAPEGEDLEQHLAKVEAYNTRPEDPTDWNEVVYRGEDFLDRMLAEKKGNVMVTAGNNAKKTEYIARTLEAGINVLADKPMAIDEAHFALLEKCFDTAREKGVLLYDIMTERFEISTILQRELSMIPALYGEQRKGSLEEPAITKESVHHFYKNVSGNALVRPAWFYDVRQQGEGIADVMVHLVDLVQWECFPEQALDYRKDIELLAARHWTTPVSRAQFKASTGLDDFPAFLQGDVVDDTLQVYANGRIDYALKGVHAKVTVTWAFEPPAGGGDTHYSTMRGTKADLVIRQGPEQGFKPELYIEPCAPLGDVEAAFAPVAGKYPGVALEPCGTGWHVVIPDTYRVGHEAHFGEVTRHFLEYLSEGSLPVWEVPNMLAKYYTTTQAWKMARE